MTNKPFVIAMFLVAIVLIGVTPQVTCASIVGVDLTAGTWLVTGADNGGNSWNGSTLVFDTQISQGQDLSLTGHFNWVGSGGQFGRENFTGMLFSDRNLQLSGFQIVQPASHIAPANFFALLSGSGAEIINGSWNGAGVTPSNSWSASLASVPLPAAALVFVPGMLGLGALANRKRT
ncbi:MAG: hypothetical protein QM706_12920 [Nitrospira sp.]